MTNRKTSAVCTILLALASVPAFAATVDEQLSELKRSLAAAYKPDGTQMVPALEQLAARAHTIAAANPGRADVLVWDATLAAKLGAARRSMSALGLAKQARKGFEAAEKLDPKALDWSSYALLANLYWHVPGWPIGFGDEKRARQLFERAIALNPNGAEPRYSYGMFLLDQKKNAEAAAQLRLAANAPLRVGETVDPVTGFSCNAMRCMHNTAETDASYRDRYAQALAKAEAGPGQQSSSRAVQQSR